jgi:hypothetical protein
MLEAHKSPDRIMADAEIPDDLDPDKLAEFVLGFWP